MEKYVTFVIFTVLLSAVTPDVTNPRSSKQYRSDYVYNHETDAFYKLHIDPRHQWHISTLCSIEGAKAMSPDSQQDIIQLHGMFKKFPDLGEYVWVADDGKKHVSAEEQPLIDRYKYFASTGSCYKIPRLPYTWSEAYSECEAEGSHLVVINSVLEHEVVHNLTMAEDPVPEARMSWYFYVGFRADRPPKNTNTTAPRRVFKTIFNQTLEQAGFSLWADGEPNNIKESEYCGTVYKNNGKFSDVNCDHKYPFICEKEVK